MRKGQSSVEYLFVVSLSLLLIIPASALFLNFSSGTEELVAASQLNRIGTDIVNTVESLYVIGNGSFVTLQVTIPDNVVNVTIQGNQELVIDYLSGGRVSQAVFFSDVNMTNSSVVESCTRCLVNMVSGRNNIRITSRGGYVSVIRV